MEKDIKKLEQLYAKYKKIKSYADGGEVEKPKDDPSFSDKVKNYFSQTPSPYDNLAKKGISPQDLSKGTTQNFAEGGKVPGLKKNPLTESDFTKPGENIPKNAGVKDFIKYNISHFDPSDPKNYTTMAGAGGVKNVASNVISEAADLGPAIKKALQNKFGGESLENTEVSPVENIDKTQPSAPLPPDIQSISGDANAIERRMGPRNPMPQYGVDSNVANQRLNAPIQVPPQEGMVPKYADGGEVTDDTVPYIPPPSQDDDSNDDDQEPETALASNDKFQQHLQNLRDLGYTVQEPTEMPEQKVSGTVPQKSQSKPASQESVSAQNPDDKEIEDKYANEDFEAGEKADESAKGPKPSSDDSEPDDSEESEDDSELKDSTPEVKKQDLGGDLKNAQSERDQNIALQQVQKGAALAGAGMAGANPNQVLKTIDENDKYVNLPVQKYTEMIANQKHDPNSQYSKDYATAASSILGIDPKKIAGMSAESLDKILPLQAKKMVNEIAMKKLIQTKQHQDAQETHLKEQEKIQREHNQILKSRADTAAKNAGNNLDSKTNKALQDYAKLTDPTTANSRAVLGTQGQTISAVEGAFALIRGTKDLNDITPQQNEEEIRILDRVLTRAAPTEYGSKSLNAHTLQEKLANIKQFWNNMPEGAQKAAFLEQIKASLAREALTAESQVMQNLARKGKAFAPYRTKAPDLFQNYDNSLKDTLFSPQLQEELTPYRAKYGPGGSQSSAHGMHKPGDMVKYKGKQYQIGTDGNTLEEVK